MAEFCGRGQGTPRMAQLWGHPCCCFPLGGQAGMELVVLRGWERLLLRVPSWRGAPALCTPAGLAPCMQTTAGAC
eukprot:scaffold78387_cov19-Tisochrysis_lutea.AAC.3